MGSLAKLISDQTRTTRRSPLFLGGLVSAFALVIAALVVTGSNSERPAGGATASSAGRALVDQGGALPRGGVRQPTEQCDDAKSTDLDSLANLGLDTPLYLPDPQTFKVTDVWYCPTANDAIVVYGSVEVTWSLGWEGVDTESKFAGMAKERENAEERSFGPYDAFVNTPTETAPLPVALFVIGDVGVAVRGTPDTSISDVTSIATSIAEVAQRS